MDQDYILGDSARGVRSLLDELFEILTLTQTRKAPAIPIICFDRGYWRRVINFEALVEEKMIGAHDLQ